MTDRAMGSCTSLMKAADTKSRRGASMERTTTQWPMQSEDGKDRARLRPLPGARALPPRARVCLRRLLLHSLLVRHPRLLGCIPFPFLLSPLHIFLHLLLISLLSSRLFLFLLPSSPPCSRFSRHFTLFYFIIVKSRSILCQVIS